ncbi:MAG: DNA translocase FtsK [Alphaproteobacteria bacterium]
MAATTGKAAAKRTERTAFLPEGAGRFLRRRAVEAGGAVLVVAGLAMLVAMLGYDRTDPSFNTATDSAAANPLGFVGAVIADLLLQSLGLVGVAAALVMIAWGVRFVRHRGLNHAWLRIALLPLALLLTAAALAAIPVFSAWPLEAGFGGFAGALLLNRWQSLTGAFGAPLTPWTAAIPLAVLGIPALLYALGLSPGEWRTLARGMLRAGRGGAQFAGSLRERLNRPDREDEPEPAGPARGDRYDREPTLAPAEPVAPPAPKPMPPDLVAERPAPKPDRAAAKRAQPSLEFPPATGDDYRIPPLTLLAEAPAARQKPEGMQAEALEQNARLLEGVLEDFGVRGEIVKVRPGPVVTLYELEPAPGTKTSRVIGLADDIARSMSAVSVRIAVVPGRSVIGIELPNHAREMVYLRALLSAEAYARSGQQLPIVLGKDIGGAPVVADLARMPHLLIAGTTGSGKSVGINAMILSLLFRFSPDACKMIMVDPKMLELSVYDDIPHLLAPVVTDPKKAVVALKWTVREMEERYRAMSKLGVRNIEGYNKRVAEAAANGEELTRRVQTGFDPDTGKPVVEEQPLDLTPLPFIVVIVDEMADLMLVAGKEIEASIQRLAQMARAAGIHLIMATQRPSVDVITGTIKANFPTRVSFQVTSKIDSRTILGEQGAEQLLGQGDMLYMAGGGRITRVHGPFVSDSEVESVVQHLKKYGEPTYIDSVTEEEDAPSDAGMAGEGDGSGDDLYDKAVNLVLAERKASTSFVQRHLQIGYNRAARIIERMEKEGLVSAANHVGKREILVGGG